MFLINFAKINLQEILKISGIRELDFFCYAVPWKNGLNVLMFLL